MDSDQRCFPHHHFKCIPVIMEKVCASGRKCFHDIHYLFENEQGCPIPADACPFNCNVCNFKIIGVNEPVPSGRFPPRRVGDCIIFEVKYKVRVWYEFFNQSTDELEMGTACGCFERELAVPVDDFDGGCILCCPEENEICVRRISLDCIKAQLVPRPYGFPDNFPPYAIEVTVEKDLFALESGRSIVCLPICRKECIDLPFPVIPGECIPFERKPKCDHYCQETDLEPGRCAQCPPPQP